MSADNVVIIEKGKDGKFRGYHRSYSAWTEGQYDVGSQCPCIEIQIAGDAGPWEDCDICAGTGIVKARKETPVFEADTIEGAIHAYDKWLEEMNDNKGGFPFIVEYGYEFDWRP